MNELYIPDYDDLRQDSRAGSRMRYLPRTNRKSRYVGVRPFPPLTSTHGIELHSDDSSEAKASRYT